MNVNPSNSPWLMALTTSRSIGVNSAFSEIKSTSKLLKSRLDLCKCREKRGEGRRRGENGEEEEEEGGKERGGGGRERRGMKKGKTVRFEDIPCAPEGIIILSTNNTCTLMT